LIIQKLFPGRDDLLHLEKNETYEINSLDDLMNCPINMMADLMHTIKDSLTHRLDRMKESGHDVECKNITFQLVNDGITGTNIIDNRSEVGK